MPVESKPVVLIADDSTTSIRILAEALGEEYVVRFATAGPAALQLALVDPKPDVILLDVMMPVVDGYQVCKALRENPATRDIPVIFVTAATDVGAQERGFEAGGVDYITKPLEPTIIRARVRTHVNLRLKTQMLESLATLDGLTVIPNRRSFDGTLKNEWLRGARNCTTLGLIIADVDCFKAYNDRYGHGAGDECLRRVARALKGSVSRAADVVARYGGEEFAGVLPDTDAAGTLHIAESMCTAVANLQLRHHASPTGYVTVSVGGASAIPIRAAEPKCIVDAADRALYLSKEQGRNQARILPVEWTVTAP